MRLGCKSLLAAPKLRLFPSLGKIAHQLPRSLHTQTLLLGQPPSDSCDSDWHVAYLAVRLEDSVFRL